MSPISLQISHAMHGGNGSILLLLIKATIILLGALCATLVMQRAAAGARHLVWLVTLAALLIVPALTMWAPIPLRVLPARSELAGWTPVSALQTVAQSPPARAEIPGARLTHRDVSTTPLTAAPHTSVRAASTWLRNANGVSILLAIWAAIALAIGASLGVATLSLRRVVKAGTPLVSPEWLNALWEISDRLGLEVAPTLLTSSEVKMPFACGVLHPTIVLPVESEGWSADRRSAVLLHELAHVRRRDLLGHTLGRVACAVYWFHPLVWSAAKHLRSESERACDDLALNCGTRAADYAEHLLDIVTSIRGDSTPLVALAMARRKEFEGRMLAILDPQLRRVAPDRKNTGLLVASLAMFAILVGAVSPVARSSNPRNSEALTNAAPQRLSHDARTDAVVEGAAKSRAVVGAHTGETTGENSIGNAMAAGNGMVVASGADASAPFAAVPSLDAAAKAQTPDERAELLSKILRTDSSASIRRTAAWGLQQYAADVPAAASALASALQRDADARVREMSAWSLERAHGDDAAVSAALMGAVRNDASDSVRATSAWSLAHMGNDGATGTLVAALADRSANVRTVAAWGIGNLHPPSAPAALVARLHDADPGVRATTAWALHNIGDASSIPALQAALRGEKDTRLQVDDIRALASMGAQSVDALRTLLLSPDPAVKQIAVTALAGGNATGPWPWPWPMPRPFP